MQPDYIYKARIVSVYDADTIRCDIDLGFGAWIMNQPLRLYGINAPEVRGAQRESGLMARDFLREYLEGAEVTIQTHKARPKGKYGRWLAVVYADDVNINELLVSEGLATTYLQ